MAQVASEDNYDRALAHLLGRHGVIPAWLDRLNTVRKQQQWSTYPRSHELWTIVSKRLEALARFIPEQQLFPITYHRVLLRALKLTTIAEGDRDYLNLIVEGERRLKEADAMIE